MIATARRIDSAGPINGVMGVAGDADIYLIHICEPTTFSASCPAGTWPELTEVWTASARPATRQPRSFPASLR